MNYKIFNWQGKELLRVEADYISLNELGQIKLMKNNQSWPVAVFPDGTLIVETSSIYQKPREFDFVNQKEKITKRNEPLFVETTPGFEVGDLNDEKIKRAPYHTKRVEGIAEKVMVKRLEDSYTPAEKELYKDEIKAAKETIVSTGNGKLDENQEERATTKYQRGKTEGHYRKDHNVDLSNLKTKAEKRKEKLGSGEENMNTTTEPSENGTTETLDWDW